MNKLLQKKETPIIQTTKSVCVSLFGNIEGVNEAECRWMADCCREGKYETEKVAEPTSVIYLYGFRAIP